jgi:hypothetical protein
MIKIYDTDDLRVALVEIQNYIFRMGIGEVDNKLLQVICDYTADIECIAHNRNTDAIAAAKRFLTNRR